MKLRNKPFYVALFMAVATLAACSDDKETYDNKAFFTSEKVSTIIVKGSMNEQEAAVKTAIAKPEAMQVQVTYAIDASKVTAYNEMYGEQAIIVPAENYEVQNTTSVIEAGALQGSDVKILFKALSQLDREKVYVLPVSVKSATMEVLESSKTAYFVIRGGALVNTAADMTKNYLRQKDYGASTLSGQTALTMETLVNISKFGKLISTIMGVEGYFLFRIGDAGVPDNQIQLATNSGNVTDPAWVVPTGQWVHIAITFNSADGATDVYINGVKKGATQYSRFHQTVPWSDSYFYIGYSYDDNRWLEGLISETRIWSRILTPEEINAKNHFYTVEPTSEGLEAYWKFDEGNGSEITDHTGHGNTLVAGSPLTWKKVTLPQ